MRAPEACTKMPKTDDMNCTPNIPEGNSQAPKKNGAWLHYSCWL